MSEINLTQIGDLSPELCLEIAKLTAIDDGSTNLWFVGVIISVLASVASNFGVNIQKYSMMMEIKNKNTIENYVEKPYIRQRLWLVGLVLVIVGAVGDFSALGFAAQSLVTTVGGFTIVANLYFAHFWLGESLDRQDIIATLLVLGGILLVAGSAEKAEKRYNLDCLVELYKRKELIIYAIIMFLFISLLYFITTRLARMKEKAPNSLAYYNWRKYHPVFPAALSGFLGAQSVLFAKSIAEILKETTKNGNNQFNEWEAYVLLLCMVTTIFSQLHWLAHGLRLFDAVLIVPIFQCCFISGGVLGGAIYFDEFTDLETWEKAMFAVGFSLTIIGIYRLTNRERIEDVTWDDLRKSSVYSAGAELKERQRHRTRFNSAGSEVGIDKRRSVNSVLANELKRRVKSQGEARRTGSIGSVQSENGEKYEDDSYIPMSIQYPGLIVEDLLHAAQLEQTIGRMKSLPQNFMKTMRRNALSNRRNSKESVDGSVASQNNDIDDENPPPSPVQQRYQKDSDNGPSL